VARRATRNDENAVPTNAKELLDNRSPFTKEYQEITKTDRHLEQRKPQQRGGDTLASNTFGSPLATRVLRPAVSNTPATPISAILNNLHELQLSPINGRRQSIFGSDVLAEAASEVGLGEAGGSTATSPRAAAPSKSNASSVVNSEASSPTNKNAKDLVTQYARLKKVKKQMLNWEQKLTAWKEREEGRAVARMNKMDARKQSLNAFIVQEEERITGLEASLTEQKAVLAADQKLVGEAMTKAHAAEAAIATRARGMQDKEDQVFRLLAKRKEELDKRERALRGGEHSGLEAVCAREEAVRLREAASDKLTAELQKQTEALQARLKTLTGVGPDLVKGTNPINPNPTNLTNLTNPTNPTNPTNSTSTGAGSGGDAA
jgi:DNA repair exonuclease SbcCD ATPase subunit